MNFVLLKKAGREVRLILPCFLVVMFAFQILFVWLTSRIELESIRIVLENLPSAWKRLLPVSIDTLSTYAGRIAIGYSHPIVVFGIAFWAISRGSDTVSGPLGRGTLEIVLAQPVRRVSLLASNMAITTLGSALMAAVCWLGTFTGISLIPKLHGIPASPYAGCAVNVFAYAFFLAALTTLLSSADRYRSRTIGVAVGFYIVALLLKIIGQMSDRLHGLIYGSFLAAFEPERFVDPQYDAATLALRYDLPLIVGGIACYIAAGIIFSRRDLPAPL